LVFSPVTDAENVPDCGPTATLLDHADAFVPLSPTYRQKPDCFNGNPFIIEVAFVQNEH
jgi:hypothetical protein